MTEEEAFLERLLATFRVEAKEHLDALYHGLAELEHTEDNDARARLVETVFREAHSLKGAARSVNESSVETLCQSLESTLAAMKRGDIAPSQALFDHLMQSLQQIGGLLEQSLPPREAPLSMPEPARTREAAPPVRRKQVLAEKPTSETVRIATDRLDALLLQTEELLAAKLLIRQRRQELFDLQAMVGTFCKEWAQTRQTLPSGHEHLAPWRALFDRHEDFIKELYQQLHCIGRASEQDHRLVSRMVDDLLDDMKKALMLPFSTLLEGFPRLVRELARDYGKDIEWRTQGEELEADRRILEALKDPLIHLVRNAIDHGIEHPEIRRGQGKPDRGLLSVSVRPRSGNRVEILVEDDGAGIDARRVKAQAERLGLLSAAEATGMDEKSALSLIYQSGVSTSPVVTEISGRGLGLAIVSEKIDALGGNIVVDSTPGKGTRFVIVLPLTLATYRGIIVQVGGQPFVLPTSQVELTARIRREEVLSFEGRPAVNLNGNTYALARLGDVLGIRHQDSAGPFLQIALLGGSGKHIAFVVDEVVDEQEVLVKNLGRQLRRVRNISAATILGNGKAVPILNINDLIRSAILAPVPASEPARVAEETRKRILVVEDSITARGLIKGILELAGFRVTTAVDGLEGYAQLRDEHFDLVVSDVEMPRMNGFELTSRIRADERLADMPVVLVTALASDADRARGIEAGADAYIVKRSFEQSDLLAAVKRLV